MKREYPVLAREGRVHLVAAVAVGAGATWVGGYWSLIVWVLVALVFNFFRDPRRRIDARAGAVVSPASGQIVGVAEVDNPYLDGARSLKVSIFMNIFSVHSNLIPIGGTVERCRHYPGKFFNAALDKSSAHNERNAVWIRSAAGETVVCVQIAGLIARRIVSSVQAGDAVATGQRYGFIRFGSRVDLYLPTHARLVVKLGQWVDSGNDVIGFCRTPTDAVDTVATVDATDTVATDTVEAIAPVATAAPAP